jgi:hypothetical protein
VAQAAEHLIGKQKALSSNFSPTKKKKNLDCLVVYALIF